jgi:pimeloyl-ACP methyl ester carboxylesterase
MPGYGGSTGESSLTFEGITARLVEWLDHLALDTVDLVGLSFGGMHALHAALALPGRIRSLTLADTSPAFGLDGTDPARWQAERTAALTDGATPADLAGGVLDAIVATPLPADRRSELIEAFGRITAEGFRASVACLPSHDVRHRLAEIMAPTLVIVGELDRETPVAYSRLLHDGIPNSTLVILPEVGHLSPSEDPEAFNHQLSRHLDRVQATLSPGANPRQPESLSEPRSGGMPAPERHLA